MLKFMVVELVNYYYCEFQVECLNTILLLSLYIFVIGILLREVMEKNGLNRLP